MLALICFRRADDEIVHLLVVNREAFSRRKSGSKEPQFAPLGEWMTATWVDADHAYLLTTKGSRAALEISRHGGYFSALMPIARCIILSSAALGLISCAHLAPSDFAESRPVFDPVEFFSGRTSSSGVLETRRGMPSQVVTTETVGRREGDILFLEQDLRFGDGRRQHRSWRIQKIDAHRYEATANDIIGVAQGEAYGNVFHWSFTLALSPGNPFARVRMSQWMYLQPDGRTMINHSTIKKAGFVVAQVTEQFRRGIGGE